jgi:hypothetical protein
MRKKVTGAKDAAATTAKTKALPANAAAPEKTTKAAAAPTSTKGRGHGGRETMIDVRKPDAASATPNAAASPEATSAAPSAAAKSPRQGAVAKAAPSTGKGPASTRPSQGVGAEAAKKDAAAGGAPAEAAPLPDAPSDPTPAPEPRRGRLARNRRPDEGPRVVGPFVPEDGEIPISEARLAEGEPARLDGLGARVEGDERPEREADDARPQPEADDPSGNQRYPRLYDPRGMSDGAHARV